MPELDDVHAGRHDPPNSAVPRDDEREDRERLWAHILSAIEAVMPGVEPLRMGWCALRARGPARYYRGEAAAAIALISAVRASGAAEAVVGIACGVFAAEQAARAVEGDPGIEVPAPGVRVASAEVTRELLDPLPITRAADEELAEVLIGLGIHTLGAFAALPEAAVVERFGRTGLVAHRRARGASRHITPDRDIARAPEVRPRAVLPDYTVRYAFEPPLDGSDQLAFASSIHAETLVRRLFSHGLVCTELRITLIDDAAHEHDRLWAHPARFTATDVVNRLRWQAEAMPTGSERGGAGIAEVHLAPVRTARAAEHEPGLWSTAPDERVHHHLTRVQSLLGHEGVGTGQLEGGRTSAERQRLIPWGTATASAASRNSPESKRSSNSAMVRPRGGPWPGHLIGPKPNLVFPRPLAARLVTRDGADIGIDTAGLLKADPYRLGLCSVNDASGPVSFLPAEVCGWSAPWPLRDHWWRTSAAPPRHRLQLLLDSGDAWLLQHTGQGWAAEGRYD